MRKLGALGWWVFVASALAGCQDEFPLGSWGERPLGQGGMESSAGGGGAGARTGGTAGAPAGAAGATMRADPTCNEVGTPGPVNAPGPLTTMGQSNIGTTNLYTDWSWPAPMDSIEWDLLPESDPPHDGYYWAHQFSFVNGLTGFFGLQAHGGFQLNPTTEDPKPKVDFTKMAVFWMGGSLPAELGDIEYPDARVMGVTARGTDWTTVHAKYEWSACTVYRLRLAKDGTDASGNVWYGAWIEDRSSLVLTKIGRIAVPPEWGQFSRLSTTLTTRVDDKPPAVTSCDQPEPASAIFGTPSGNENQLWPVGSPRFQSPLRCPSSRFTDLPEGVRHEIGLSLSP